MSEVKNIEKVEILKKLKEELPYPKREYGVSRIALFGSLANGNYNLESDVDIVVEFDGPVGFKFIDFCEYIEKIMGRKVDVLTLGGIDSIRIEEVKDSVRESLEYV